MTKVSLSPARGTLKCRPLLSCTTIAAMNGDGAVVLDAVVIAASAALFSATGSSELGSCGTRASPSVASTTPSMSPTTWPPWPSSLNDITDTGARPSSPVDSPSLCRRSYCRACTARVVPLPKAPSMPERRYPSARRSRCSARTSAGSLGRPDARDNPGCLYGTDIAPPFLDGDPAMQQNIPAPLVRQRNIARKRGFYFISIDRSEARRGGPASGAAQRKRAAACRGPRVSCVSVVLEVHAAHAAVVVAAGHRGCLLLWPLRHHRLGGDKEARHRGGVLKRQAHDLGGVDDAGLHEVHVLAALSVEAMVGVRALEELADHHGAVGAGVLGDLARRHLDRLADDVDADALVVVLGLDLGKRLGGVEQRGAAAADDALLDRRAGRVHGVVNPVLALLHLDLGRAADPDHRHAARELRQPLLQLLAVVVGGGLLDLRLDLADPALDVLLLAGAVDDRGVLLLDPDPARLAEHVEGDRFELDAKVLGDQLAAGEDR